MLEKIVLSNLILNEQFARKTFPFLKAEYFKANDKTVFNLIASYVGKYSSFPSKEALQVDLLEQRNLTEEQFKECRELIENLQIDPKSELNWLLAETEKFCKDRAIYNAVLASIKTLENDKEPKGLIPALLSDALSVSFDTHIGHDFLEDYESRYDFYNRREEKISFDIDILNKITKEGVGRKWLVIFIAGVAVGKSLVMVHCAAHNLTEGKNVLYITLEMAEEYIAQRIDANLLDIPLDYIIKTPLEEYERRIRRLKQKTLGKLIIKEYPTSAASVTHFRHLLNELKIKKNFVPDVIYVDYLNICASARVRMSGNVNSYTYYKMISEEIRGLAVENNVPIFTATQFNRDGARNSDPTMQDSSDSYGIPMGADLMLALTRDENLDAMGQICFKQIKNRYGDENIFKRFTVGVDKSRMRLYNVENPTENLSSTGVNSTTSEPDAFELRSFKDF